MNPTFSSMSWFLFCQGESCEGEGCQEEAKEDHESQTKKITLFAVVFCVSCVVGCVTIKFKFKLTGNYLVFLFFIQRLSGVALTMRPNFQNGGATLLPHLKNCTAYTAGAVSLKPGLVRLIINK